MQQGPGWRGLRRSNKQSMPDTLENVPADKGGNKPVGLFAVFCLSLRVCFSFDPHHAILQSMLLTSYMVDCKFMLCLDSQGSLGHLATACCKRWRLAHAGERSSDHVRIGFADVAWCLPDPARHPSRFCSTKCSTIQKLHGHCP